MNSDDLYFIPSVPQFKRDLNTDLDDTIGDDFFEKLVLHSNTKRVLSPIVPPKPTKPQKTAPVADPGRRPVRRSLLKPGRPSVGIKPEANKQNEEKPEAPKAVNVSPPKAPVTRSKAAQFQTAETVPSDPKMTKPSTLMSSRAPFSVFNSKLPPPTKMPIRRSLLKPGRPSVGSKPNDENAEPENKSEIVKTVIDSPKARIPAPVVRLSPKAPITRSKALAMEKEKENTPSRAKSTQSKSHQSTFTKTIIYGMQAVTPQTKAKRRSFMDPTISSSFKFNNTPSKK